MSCTASSALHATGFAPGVP